MIVTDSAWLCLILHDCTWFCMIGLWWCSKHQSDMVLCISFARTLHDSTCLYIRFPNSACLYLQAATIQKVTYLTPFFLSLFMICAWFYLPLPYIYLCTRLTLHDSTCLCHICIYLCTRLTLHDSTCLYASLTLHASTVLTNSDNSEGDVFNALLSTTLHDLCMILPASAIYLISTSAQDWLRMILMTCSDHPSRRR